jgi:hypothetical protein
MLHFLNLNIPAAKQTCLQNHAFNTNDIHDVIIQNKKDKTYIKNPAV